TPKGTDINKKGITPDIQIDLTRSQQRQLASDPRLLGTRQDPHYSRALSILSNNNFASQEQNQLSRKPLQLQTR
ncbi:MAG: peptidase S41, partial [Cyanobacteria bacterium P01_C01_bin.38]